MRTEELLRAANAPLADIFEGLLADVGAHTRLSARDRALAELSALMGCGGTDAFRARFADALAEGLAPEAVREAVMQAAAYLGMGRALPFVRAAAQAFAERNIAFPPEAENGAEEDGQTRAVRGEALQVAIFGEGMRGFHASGDALTRPINRLLSENCFGDYYVRSGLTVRERELVTFCLLAAQGGCEPQLAGHVAGNFHVGNDAAFLGEVILVLLPWIGYPRSLNALGCVRGAIKA